MAWSEATVTTPVLYYGGKLHHSSCFSLHFSDCLFCFLRKYVQLPINELRSDYMNKVRRLNQKRKDYVYDPKPYRKNNQLTNSQLPIVPFLIGFMLGVTFSVYLYKVHPMMFANLL